MEEDFNQGMEFLIGLTGVVLRVLSFPLWYPVVLIGKCRRRG